MNTKQSLVIKMFENKKRLSIEELYKKAVSFRAFTIVSNFESGWNLILYIRSFGYEGVQNDSLRYCDVILKSVLDKHKIACIGTNGSQILISKCKRRLRGKGLKYYEKPRIYVQKLKKHFGE